MRPQTMSVSASVVLQYPQPIPWFKPPSVRQLINYHILPPRHLILTQPIAKKKSKYITKFIHSTFDFMISPVDGLFAFALC